MRLKGNAEVFSDWQAQNFQTFIDAGLIRSFRLEISFHQKRASPVRKTRAMMPTNSCWLLHRR